MGGRLLKIIMVLWWLGWSCVLAPGHTRGAVRLDGSLARGNDGGSVSLMFGSLPACCRARAKADASHKNQSKQTSASCECAICSLVAHTGVGVDVPPVVEAPHAGVFLPLAQMPRSAELVFVQTYLSRGPPV